MQVWVFFMFFSNTCDLTCNGIHFILATGVTGFGALCMLSLKNLEFVFAKADFYIAVKLNYVKA